MLHRSNAEHAVMGSHITLRAIYPVLQRSMRASGGIPILRAAPLSCVVSKSQSESAGMSAGSCVAKLSRPPAGNSSNAMATRAAPARSSAKPGRTSGGGRAGEGMSPRANVRPCSRKRLRIAVICSGSLSVEKTSSTPPLPMSENVCAVWANPKNVTAAGFSAGSSGLMGCAKTSPGPNRAARATICLKPLTAQAPAFERSLVPLFHFLIGPI